MIYWRRRPAANLVQEDDIPRAAVVVLALAARNTAVLLAKAELIAVVQNHAIRREQHASLSPRFVQCRSPAMAPMHQGLLHHRQVQAGSELTCFNLYFRMTLLAACVILCIRRARSTMQVDLSVNASFVNIRAALLIAN